MKKAKAFLSVWRWFLTFQLRKFRSGVVLAVTLGAAARICAIVAFVVTIKCVVWMADPGSVPAMLSGIASARDWVYRSLLIFIPAIVFLMQAILQMQQEKASFKLQHHVASELTKMAYDKYVSDCINRSGNTETPSKIAAELKTHHRNMLSIEAKVLSVIGMSFVLGAVLLAGFFIHWKIMGLMTIVGVLSSLWFFLHQHYASRLRKDQLASAKERELHALNRLKSALQVNPSSFDALEGNGINKNESIDELAAGRYMEQSINSRSYFMINAGQAAVVAIFLFAVLTMGVGDLSLSWIAILAIVFRFLLGYGLAIVRDTATLMANHHKLVYVMKKTSKVASST